MSIAERERAYRKRMACSTALALVLQLAAWWFLPSPIGSPLRAPIPQFGGGGLALLDVSEVGGEPARASADESPPAADPSAQPAAEEAEPVIEPVTAPAPEAAAEPVGDNARAAATLPADAAGAGAAALGTGGAGADGTSAGAGGGDGAAAAGSAIGQPRLIVHPRVPSRILVQRRIDDFVLLQVLVTADGHVRDVRILRDIPNCAECSASAVEAARQNVYNPPVVPPDSAGVWSPPFPMRFSYRR